MRRGRDRPPWRSLPLLNSPPVSVRCHAEGPTTCRLGSSKHIGSFGLDSEPGVGTSDVNTCRDTTESPPAPDTREVLIVILPGRHSTVCCSLPGGATKCEILTGTNGGCATNSAFLFRQPCASDVYDPNTGISGIVAVSNDEKSPTNSANTARNFRTSEFWAVDGLCGRYRIWEGLPTIQE